MKKKSIKRMLNGAMICSLLMTMELSIFEQSAYAAGKTIEAFKVTDWEADNKANSDAKVFYNGVKAHDSAYTGVYNENVTNANFYNKTRTIKYWASHGNTSGDVWGNNGSSADLNVFDKSNFSWAGGNLEFVFLAACNQLNKEGNNPVKQYAKAMIGSKAVRAICGYHDYAPSAADHKVSEAFLKYAKTGESVKSSWIKANEDIYNNQNYTNCKNYAVLTHSGNVQYSRFPGFSNTTYTRPGASSKTILRFRKGVTSGENIATASLSVDSNLSANINDVPLYRLKATEVELNINENCEDMVFHNDNILTTNNGEIGHKAIKLDKSKLLELSKKYFESNYDPSSEITLDSNNVEIETITVSNAMDDTDSEKTVAYVTSFKNEYMGIPIEGDEFKTITDKDGVKFTSCQWHTLDAEKIEPDDKIVSVDEAETIVSENVEVPTKTDSLFSNSKMRVASEPNFVKDVKVVYALNTETGYYEPTYQFTMNDSSLKEVNCFTGELVERWVNA